MKLTTATNLLLATIASSYTSPTTAAKIDLEKHHDSLESRVSKTSYNGCQLPTNVTSYPIIHHTCA